MNEITSGHKVTNCPGKWIDIGTLKDPRAQVCSACRGHRQKPTQEDTDDDDSAAVEDALADIFEKEEAPPHNDSLRVIGYIILSAATGAIVALAINMLYAWSMKP